MRVKMSEKSNTATGIICQPLSMKCLNFVAVAVARRLSEIIGFTNLTAGDLDNPVARLDSLQATQQLQLHPASGGKLASCPLNSSIPATAMRLTA